MIADHILIILKGEVFEHNLLYNSYLSLKYDLPSDLYYQSAARCSTASESFLQA